MEAIRRLLDVSNQYASVANFGRLELMPYYPVVSIRVSHLHFPHSPY